MDILAFEDSKYEALETALYLLFPGAESINIETEYDPMSLDHYTDGIRRPPVDFVVTDMMMPTTQKSRGVQSYAGVPIMLQCMEEDIPAVCISSAYHHDEHVNFANHMLRKVGLEMVDQTNKSTPEGWIESLKFSFGGVHDYWTTRPRTAIRSAIQEWHEGLVIEQELEARKNDE
jgi:hypothetical protein